MAVHRKTSPEGVDFEIDRFMVYLSNNLTFNAGFVSEWYPRVYVNQIDKESANRFQPDHFDESPNNNDYKEVFPNDRVDLQSFFIAAPDYTFDPEIGKQRRRISIVFMANLEVLYPGATHRNDEEFQVKVFNVWDNWNHNKRFEFVSVENEIDNVFREFDRAEIRFEDMHPRHCVRFNFDVTYKPECCTDC